jgi:carboxyl-terminal processing protease
MNLLRIIKAIFLFTLLAITIPIRAQPTPEAQAYLDRALELIHANHRKVSLNDWPKITAEAQLEIANSKTAKDTYPAIRNALRKLNEPHSFFMEPSAAPQKIEGKGPVAEALQPASKMPSWDLEGKRFGVISLPGLNTYAPGGPQKGIEYTAMVRDGLITMDKSKLCGWIVDLRQNDGGNMWPMLWGLDPLLGTGPFGAFLGAGGRKETWVRANGSIFPTSETLPVTPPSFPIKQAGAPVAILIGPITASSGEMTAIAFLGRKNVRLFGASSAGFTSANRPHQLSDGAYLVLTEMGVQDRTGREYTGPMIPDENVGDAQAKSAAMKWLKQRC